MPQLIPLTDDARQTFRTLLGGQSVRIRAWWQPSDEHWYLTLAWTDGRIIVAGVRLVEGGQPLAGHVLEFSGRLDVMGAGPLVRSAWSTSHFLVYTP